MWIVFDNPTAWEAVYYLGPASGLTGGNNMAVYVHSDNYFRIESANGGFFDVDYKFVPGKWVHMTVLFKGASSLQDCEMYIDNVKLLHNGTSWNPTTSYSITGSNNLNIGGRYLTANGLEYPLECKIANFRLFDRALTSDEIYQLYAYQKEYFGHGDLSMTLKAGRLGIGTSEPRAALDVRGDVHISGSLRKTRAQMFARLTGSFSTTNANWVTLAPYGEMWTSYSENPLFSIQITGDYTDTTDRVVLFRLAVKNERTNVVTYFPSSSGWIKYMYINNNRLDGHGFHGIMSNLTPGDSYTGELQVNGNHSSSYYRWNSAYGTLTGIVWD
jgi:hypothetical protein